MEKMIKIGGVVAMLLLLQSIAIAQQNELFVSPKGKDSNAGTFKKPFKTIERAKQEVAKLKSTAGNISVNLREGVYQLDETLTFTAENGGSNGNRVSYKAYENEKVVISGGKKIEGWEVHENGIWKAPAKGLEFRQIYVNGRQTTRARHPNTGKFHRIAIWDPLAEQIVVSSLMVKDWKQFDKVEMIIQMFWTEQVLRLKSYEITEPKAPILPEALNYAKLSIQKPESDIIFVRDWPPKVPGQVFHFENAYEFIDTPGEWYLDTEADSIYYMPAENTDMSTAEVIVPTLETLVAVKGELGKRVKDLTFEGISFQHSNWLTPSKQGYNAAQACQYNIVPTRNNEQYIMRPSAAVYVENGENIQFLKNEFTKIGNAAALDFHFGVSNSLVKGNLFHHISGTSMLLAKFNDPDVEIHTAYNPEDKREICDNNTISNNYITKVGMNYPGCNALAVGYGKNTMIEHNEISYAPYSGISLGWGWTHEDNVMENNTIQYNDIHHVSQHLADAGGIYLLSKQPGTKIYRNYIHDIVKSEWADEHPPFTGIYLDEATGGTAERPVVLEENMVTAGGYTRYFQHMTGYVSYAHNIFYDFSFGGQEYPRRMETKRIVREKAGLQPEFKYLKKLVPNHVEE